jgi:hypothetical protein
MNTPWVRWCSGVFERLRAAGFPDPELVPASAERTEEVMRFARECAVNPGLVPSHVAEAAHGAHDSVLAADFAVDGTRVRLSVIIMTRPRSYRSTRRVEAFVLRRLCTTLRASIPVLNAMYGRRGDVFFVFLPSARRRYLPKQRAGPVLSDHVNGGITSLRDQGRIMVHRLEDACKVAIHELLHLYGADGDLEPSDAVRAVEAAIAADHRISYTPGGVHRLGISEAYVDAMACLMHAVLYAVWFDRGRVRQAVERTSVHIEDVAARLIRHYRGAAWIEGTHAFAYYVCKAALWRRLDAFLQSFASVGGQAANPRIGPKTFGPFLRASLAAFAPVATRGGGRSLRMTPLD